MFVFLLAGVVAFGPGCLGSSQEDLESGAEHTSICEELQGPILSEAQESRLLDELNAKLAAACEDTECCSRTSDLTFCEEQSDHALSDLGALVEETFPGFQYVSHRNSLVSRSPLEITILNEITQQRLFLIVSHNDHYLVSVAVEAEPIVAIFECGQCIESISDFCQKDLKVLPSCGQRVRDWQADPKNSGKVVEAAHCVWGADVIAGYPTNWQRIDTEVSTWDCEACLIKTN